MVLIHIKHVDYSSMVTTVRGDDSREEDRRVHSSIFIFIQIRGCSLSSFCAEDGFRYISFGHVYYEYVM
jgi:hypothetical protein